MFINLRPLNDTASPSELFDSTLARMLVEREAQTSFSALSADLGSSKSVVPIEMMDQVRGDDWLKNERVMSYSQHAEQVPLLLVSKHKLIDLFAGGTGNGSLTSRGLSRHGTTPDRSLPWWAQSFSARAFI